MKIAWVLYGSLEQRTGGTIYDAEVVKGLRGAGDDVHVVSIDAGGDVAGEIFRIAPEVVVGDELCFRELAVAFPKLVGVKRVLLVHHLTAWETELAPTLQSTVRAEEEECIAACDLVIATSRTTRDRLVAEGTKVAIDVVLPGADRLARGPRSAATDGVRFVFLGSVVPRKRVVELVRAFGGGAHESGRLVLVGSVTRDPAYVGAVERAIGELRVTMLGEVDEGGVARALAEADALVMPSSLEGYGIAATEAIFAGLPVIAARAHGLEEALASCPEARIFADDEPALASALLRFATDASLRASMTAAAGAAAPRMPTWRSCATSFRDALSRA